MRQSSRRAKAELGVGEPLPLGLTRTCDGFNLAVFSRHASAVSVLLSDPATDALLVTLAFDPDRNRTGDIWHVALTEEAMVRPMRSRWTARGLQTKGIASTAGPVYSTPIRRPLSVMRTAVNRALSARARCAV